jgi:hypothetical protein
MEDSDRQSLILEPGNCQEGKYEEEGRKEENCEMEVDASIYIRLLDLKIANKFTRET